MTDAGTVAALLIDALAAHDRLCGLGEEIEDEWTYVTDLGAAWRAELEAVATDRGREIVADDVAVAVGLAVEEAERITDPHRAIDWISTFPQVVLLALGARA